ncbi:NAD(+) synthase [Candidatus Roizmanbacteria bacterium CG11_big_fil_rev_8_21_14_0_20_36_8]|uniref:NH(3)-dependent NAD(+) synthetase n=1 Tax=Candidatus Roizmanbacteria bacterium CG11_big_fil_rev_8_21_14_0_20_36_8 TaxID=1974856 RepID=A0A2M6IVT0_9BACT|nr:MAG: NAD(+) synthase [Candidatus Roizmanbacteria bacterium CG11_big_fil_rev_8_21_14_0_20_36_8]
MRQLNNIQKHITSVLTRTKKKNVIIAVSGGIDSATALYILSKTIPLKNIYVIHLYYFDKSIKFFETTIESIGLPKSNILLHSIKDTVDVIASELQIKDDIDKKIRLGNVMARIRMAYLFDQAKKLDALVCGTENKTERLLGYFTRFGDSASDFEVISHLYKSQVRKLACYLQIPREILEIPPTAGLWEGQTDEGEMGATYDEIDKVLEAFFDKNIEIDEIEKKGYKNARKILSIVECNKFKQEVPYFVKSS